MIDTKDRPVLLTGAAGNLGRHLARTLGGKGWMLRLSDLRPFPDPLPPRATFTEADLSDGMTILRLAEGCGLILHFGGASTDDYSYEQILGANLRGLYHIYEAARRERARVVFASSNHSIGFHERSEKLDDNCAFRPDSYYGLSKVYGEMMGRLYFDKHGVETVAVRIGSCFPEPVDARMLSTWLSYADLARLVERCAATDRVDYSIVWGASANTRTFWRRDSRDLLGWNPQDSADPFAAQLGGKLSGDPVSERYQGGAYAARGYSRS